MAFDGYVLGRPRIDRVLVNYVGDVNAIVASILGGEQDMVPMGARFDATQLIAVQHGWGPDSGSAILVPFGIRTIWLQFRDPTAPWARDVRVRRALVHATDRQGMSEALQYGMTTPADTFIMITDGAYPVLERRSFARYPYDEQRARQLLAEAGWSAGADNLLRDGAGQSLNLDLSATGQGSNVQEIETVSSQWRAMGVQTNPVPLPPQAANLDERKNTVRGGFLWPWSPSISAPQNLASTQIPTERTAWKGSNYAGYSNPDYDQLFDRFSTTLQAPQRREVLAEIMALLGDEVPVIPIYYYGIGVIARRGLDGPGMIPPLQTASAWTISSWDLR
jgi:peptide/nickel transport system substrate-binding protein